jgi:hypothetical protein
MSGFAAGKEYGGQLARTLAIFAVKTQGAQFEKIVAWLASLRLLHGVPSWYIIPDERMLPEESIKFFQVDENWISCLIDGAFSIGNSTAADRERFGNVVPELLSRVAAKARTLRDEKFGEVPSPAEEGRASGKAVMGFLLRSALVAGWPGLQVHAWSGDQYARKIRFEAVGPNILLCLFDHQVDKVVFSEPVEILHFGLDENVTVPMSSKRVINPTSLAASMQTALVANGGMDSAAAFTPAEFALELIAGAQQVTFTLDSAGEGA